MSDEKSSGSSGGIGIGGALLLIFVTLKLTGHIAWSWWWVLSPLWIGFSLIGLVVLGAVIVALIAAIVERARKGTKHTEWRDDFPGEGDEP